MRRKSVFGLFLALGVLASACGSSSDSADAESEDRTSVVAAFYPLQWLAQQVGGSAVSVSSLTPDGSEPHDLALDAKAIESLRDADVVIYLGNDFQPEVQRAIEQLPSSVRRVDALTAAGVDLLEVPEESEEHAEESGHDDEAGHAHEDHGSLDPHIWLDPVRMQAVAKAIEGALAVVAPDSGATFATNATNVGKSLDALNVSTGKKLATCTRRTIVTSHAAFQYYANRYNLTQISIAGVNPEEDPDPKTLQSISASAKAAGATTVYFEDALPSKLSETVAREIGAKTDLLSALEFKPEGNGDYITVQSDNADRLVKGLDCTSVE